MNWFFQNSLSEVFDGQQLAKKVNNVETSWALGATFDFFRNFNIH